MRFLTYSYPEVEIDVYPQGDLVMTISDKKETVVMVHLGRRHLDLLADAAIAAKARMYPNPTGSAEVLHFPPKNDAV